MCVGASENSTIMFSIPSSITTTVVNGVANFENIEVFQGTFLRKQFLVDGSLDQRFLLDNSFIDSSTIVVKVKGLADTNTLGREYSLASNILNIDSTSETYLIQEVQDEKYELLFGDGYFGKKLENGAVITATYIITDGKDREMGLLISHILEELLILTTILSFQLIILPLLLNSSSSKWW